MEFDRPHEAADQPCYEISLCEEKPGEHLNAAQFVDQKFCYVCGSTGRSIEKELGTQEGELYLRWVRCGQCQLVYLDPRPSLHALSVLYDSQGYWQGTGYNDYLAEERWRKKQAFSRAQWFRQKLQLHLPSERPNVLEVGSAAGYFLEALREAGARVEGLELSRQMVRLSETRCPTPLVVSQGFVEDSHYESGSFQGLAAWGCDSNFHNPGQTFDKFASWLAPGGLLALNFHQYDHWARRLKGHFKMMPNALYFFNAEHIQRLLELNGFRKLEMTTELHWMSVASVFHHTGHGWLKPLLGTPLAHLPLCLPIPGSYRVLAQKL